MPAAGKRPVPDSYYGVTIGGENESKASSIARNLPQSSAETADLPATNIATALGKKDTTEEPSEPKAKPQRIVGFDVSEQPVISRSGTSQRTDEASFPESDDGNVPNESADGAFKHSAGSTRVVLTAGKNTVAESSHADHAEGGRARARNSHRQAAGRTITESGLTLKLKHYKPQEGSNPLDGPQS